MQKHRRRRRSPRLGASSRRALFPKMCVLDRSWKNPASTHRTRACFLASDRDAAWLGGPLRRTQRASESTMPRNLRCCWRRRRTSAARRARDRANPPAPFLVFDSSATERRYGEEEGEDGERRSLSFSALSRTLRRLSSLRLSPFAPFAPFVELGGGFVKSSLG